jgi:hypothetical protein
MNSINMAARMAGVFYFASIVADWSGHLVFADASATVNQIVAHESLFGIGGVINMFAQVFFLLAA